MLPQSSPKELGPGKLWGLMFGEKLCRLVPLDGNDGLRVPDNLSFQRARSPLVPCAMAEPTRKEGIFLLPKDIKPNL